MKYKYPLLFILVFLFATDSGAQSRSGTIGEVDISVPTPQAAEFLRYGQIPVDLFNGLASVSIPLWQVPVKGVNVSISLSYHGSGIKPNSKGSWVGVGWNLNVGGSITRIQNGLIDEHYDPKYDDIIHPRKIGYYWDQTTLKKSDWNTQQGLVRFIDRVQCQGMYGIGNTGCPSLIPSDERKYTDWAPDEFAFNFLGYSGSFWLNHDKQWVVRENSGEKFKIEVFIDETGTQQYTYQYNQFPGGLMPLVKSVQYAIKGFNITDANGNIFYFGNDPYSVELNRRNTGGSKLTANTTSWFLRKIITHLNEEVVFEYERKYPTVNVMSSINSYEAKTLWSTGGSCMSYYNRVNLQSIGAVVQDPVYLKSITFNDYTIQFNYSEDNFKLYPALAGDNPLNSYNEYSSYNADRAYYPADEGPNFGVSPKEFKLENIIVQHSSGQQRSFRFVYFDPQQYSVNRTFLKEVVEGALHSSPLRHKFEYDGMFFDPTLPGATEFTFKDGLLTNKTDHWGFYTNKFPFLLSGVPLNNGFYQTSWQSNDCNNQNFVSPAFMSYYNQQREPDFNFTKRGSLKKITYPTGGYTELIYEANTYSKKLPVLPPYTPVTLTNNQTGGGLRIKEIRSYSDPASTPLIKKYFYNEDNGLSTGILNSAGIQYLDERTGQLNVQGTDRPFTYKLLYDNSQYPILSKNGNNVTYSKVREEVENGSTIVYEYSNYSNLLYADIAPFVSLSPNVSGQPYVRTSSRDFARGNQLKMQSFKTGSTSFLTKEETIYEDDQPAINSQNGARVYFLDPKDIRMTSFTTNATTTFQGANIWAPTISANMFYIHPYRPVEKKITEQRGSEQILLQETYTYSPYNNKLKEKASTNLSDGQTKKLTIDYTSDMAGSPYDVMIQKNMLNSVVLQRSSASNNPSLALSYLKSEYAAWNSNTLFLPQYQLSAILGNTPEIGVTIQSYDLKGNITQYLTKQGVVTTVLWGYKNEFPVLKATGIDFNQVMNAMTGVSGSTPDAKYANLQSVIDDASLQNVLNQVRTSFASNKDVQVLSYTYQIFAGVKSMTDPNGKLTTYEYDIYRRLKTIKDYQNNIVQMFCYNYAGQTINCGTTGFYNTQKSGLFTKQCANGETGSQVLYVVPAGTYSAANQVDADAAAQNDVNTNGQIYANNNGTCLTTGCTTGSGNCNGPDLKCIRGVCEKAKKVMKGYYCDGTMFQVIYQYVWSDGSKSNQFTELGGSCEGGPEF